MEWFEKEYKRRFEDDSSLEGIESGPLWDQISKSISKNKPAKRSYLKWTFLMMTIIGLLTTLLFFYNNQSEAEQEISSSVISDSMSKDNSSNNSTSKNSFLTNEVKTKSEIKTSKSNLDPKNLSTKYSNQVESNANASSITTSNNESQSNDFMESKSHLSSHKESASNSLNNHIDSETIDENRSDEIIGNTNFTLSKSNPLSNQLEAAKSQLISEIIKTKEEDHFSQESDQNPSEIVNRITININPLRIPESKILSDPKKIALPTVSIPIVKVNKKIPLAINIHGGSNFFSLKYKDVEDPELFTTQANDSLGPLQVGNSFGINLEYQLNSNWSISGGLSLNNYENKMSAVLAKDTTMLLNEKIRNFQKIRTVMHHNKLSTITIPLSITYDYRLSRNWSLGTSLGVSYSIVKSQSGKLLGRNQDIIEYSDNDNSQFGNFISYRVNPYIRYYINDHLAINLLTGLSYQNHGISQAIDLEQSSIIYNIGMGLRYKL